MTRVPPDRYGELHRWPDASPGVSAGVGYQTTVLRGGLHREADSTSAL